MSAAHRAKSGTAQAHPGQSYHRDEFEAIPRAIYERVRLGAADITAVVTTHRASAATEPDRLTLARVKQERDKAWGRYLADRNADSLAAAMARLDDEERNARTPVEKPALTALEAAEYLMDLPRLYADMEPADRKALNESLFAEVKVLGIREARVTPTRLARQHGLAEAFGDEVVMVGARGLAPTLSNTASGSTPGTRSRCA